MKITKLFFTLAIMLMVLGCNENSKKNDLTVEGLIGKVKSVRQSKFKAIEKFGEITKGERTFNSYENTLIIYNKKGNEIEQNWYNSDGSLDSKWTYKHDDKGNNIEENWYNSDGSSGWKHTYQYDDKGNNIEENWYNSDGSLDEKLTYKYDDKGNLIELSGYISDGSLFVILTYKYDDKGNKIEETFYAPDGILYYKETYKYDYDQQRNWILRIESHNTIPKYIIEREIIYYN